MKNWLSFIIPVYNGEKYITQAVESILNQAETGIEIVIIDDGSTDDSYLVCKELADKYNISVDTAKHKGLIGKGVIAGQKVILVKPMTYMNNSGECIREVMDYYKCDIDDFIVIFDDISLDVGKLRLRAKGSAGGHNGIKSIIAHLGSDKFKRIKFGVGDKPKNWDLADWVLGKFPTDEYATLREANKKACEAVECILTDGIESGMNKYNG